jgi:hypothetical protein
MMSQDYRYYEDSNGKWTVEHFAKSINSQYWYALPKQCETEQDAIAMIKRLRNQDGWKPEYKYVE